ncbi:MAG: PAS domain-containing protein [Euryarchaeota archaeon]|nr:PAS domain-containing protein [Euryarchaeota archaeon]MBU4340409.1 PAS domain-containing protein [Euryarchaeota archaeon]MBU4454043.1 PAS domain-containing protein [Euryarchaeota archaeon]
MKIRDRKLIIIVSGLGCLIVLYSVSSAFFSLSRDVLLYLLGILLVSCLIYIWKSKNYVNSRIASLNAEINRSGKFSGEIKPAGGDEITGLSRSIKTILDELERSRSRQMLLEEALADQRKELEKTIYEKTIEIEIENRKLRQKISEHEKIEERLRNSEEKYRSFLESTEDSIYMVDRDCNYLYVNPKHLSRLGVGNFHGRGYGDCHISTQTDAFKQSIHRVYETGKPEQQEHEYRGKQFMRSMSPLKDPVTKIVGSVIVISTDITVRKKAEEIHIENERLAFANKSKSEFLANMSHELRTPLNSIIGFTELMRQKMAGDLNVKQERYVENVLNSSKFLLNLINDILDLSKVEAGKIELIIERISVPVVISETVTLLKERASKNNVTLKKELDPELDFINADKQRIKQILFNLLNNAIKFSKKDGGVVSIRTKKEGDNAIISVSDTGIGIREEDLGKLFKEFEQVNSDITRNYGGTGLGLAISRKLVELHGGRIWVKSRFGEGTTFTFTLPIAKEGNVEGSELIRMERRQ